MKVYFGLVLLVFSAVELNAQFMSNLPAINTREIGDESCLQNVVFCLDNSGSLGEYNFKKSKEFAKYLADRLNVSPTGNRAAMVDFEDEARMDWDLNKYTEEQLLLDAILAIPYAGHKTNTSGALRVARQIFSDPGAGARTGVQNTIIMITDGEPTKEPETLDAEIKNTKDAGIKIMAVGVTTGVKEDTLLNMASTPEDYVHVSEFEDLDRVKLIEENCELKIVTEAPTPSPSPDEDICDQD